MEQHRFKHPLRGSQRSFCRRLALGWVAALGVALLTSGCETGRTNKAHAEWQHLSDDTTTGKPESKQALGPGDHHPPVPGSPTAAGPDGNQPPDDMQAASRRKESSEAAPPR